MQILMVDLNPGRAAASTAANNLFRCLLGAGSTAVVILMIEKMGVGWTYTFAALVWTLFSPLLIWMIWIGPKWRKEKKASAEKEQETHNPKSENTDTSGQAASGKIKQPDGHYATRVADEQNELDRERDKLAMQKADPSDRKELATEPAAPEKADR